ncbi:hypothetical protein DERF_014570 [Dermatophagoides farinae]|uniref:Uncharacterized protein n=1 Tax=Dermatophagoides farinae TaxID=6954 RepID=A0A922HIH8_DERFA|nr:hypothetical protein DERF_014549 [Dermatophagoides farinae]KAH9493841.1 hypothetical protein DERF_014570 [Dermatophagoides farinae]
MYRIQHRLPVDHLSDLKFQIIKPVSQFHHPSVSFNFSDNVCDYDHDFLILSYFISDNVSDYDL